MAVLYMRQETGHRERCHALHSASPCLPGKSWKQWDTMNSSVFPSVWKWCCSSSCSSSPPYRRNRLNSLEVSSSTSRMVLLRVKGIRTELHSTFSLKCCLSVHYKLEARRDNGLLGETKRKGKLDMNLHL